MPVVFNSPPSPTANVAGAAASRSAADQTSTAGDAFALLLAAAGVDPGTVAGKDANASPEKGLLRDARDGDIVRDDYRAPARVPPFDPRLPVVPITRDTTADASPPASEEIALDPAAIAAALSSIIASGLNAEALPPRDPLPAIVPVERGVAAELAPVASDKTSLDPAATMTAVSAAMASGRMAAAQPLRNAAAGAAEAATASANRTASAKARGDGDRVESAAPTAAPAIPVRVDESFSVPSREFPREIVTTLKESPDAGASIVSAQAVATGRMVPTAAPVTVYTIDTPVTAPGWSSELASRLSQVVMLRNDRAEFHLHPAELGPIDVQISFAADQAIVLITAAHATTRDALEQALPYLRDMLADQGIALGQASVQEERTPAEQGGTRRDQAALTVDSTQSPDTKTHAVRLKGLVDVFA